MQTTDIGKRAEQAAAEYLVRQGYEILELNYRRKYCEIDIVARSDNQLSFVEVKYRATNNFGGGLDYVTAAKLQHMTRAAQVWVAEHHWQGDYNLAAIEVGGPDYEVLDFIQSVY